MARVKKADEAAAVSRGVEALAALARGQRLAPDDMLIAVVDGDSLTVRTVRKPTVREGTAARSAYGRYVARRLAEIDAAVSEMLSTHTGGGSWANESLLTAEEERVLASAGFDTSTLRVEETEPLTQTALEYARLLQSSLSVDQAAQLLGVNPSRVRQRLTGDRRTLYGMKEGKSWRVPTFQFAGKKPVPGTGAVVAALPRDLHPVAVQRWLTTPHPDLRIDPEEERSVAPLDWLRTGRAPEVVVDLARGL